MELPGGSAELPVLVVVDAANVVGSVPDGWWRDRAGANARLRDALALLDPAHLTGGRAAELVLVVEGAAAGIAPVPGVRVVAAPASGDDTVVDVVAGEASGRDCVVVTADRGLRERVARLGARVVGPAAVRPATPPAGRRDR